LPSKIIELKGGTKHTHRPLRKNEPKPPTTIPKCPEHLDKEERKVWKREAPMLCKMGITTILDVSVLARYCQGEVRQIRLKEELNTIMNPTAESNDLKVRAAQYRIEYERWNQARIETAKGLLKLTKDGKYIENPYLKIERQSFVQMMITQNKINNELKVVDDQMRKDEIEMGKTPSSRARVKVTSPPKEEDDKERFFD